MDTNQKRRKTNKDKEYSDDSAEYVAPTRPSKTKEKPDKATEPEDEPSGLYQLSTADILIIMNLNKHSHKIWENAAFNTFTKSMILDKTSGEIDVKRSYSNILDVIVKEHFDLDTISELAAQLQFFIHDLAVSIQVTPLGVYWISNGYKQALLMLSMAQIMHRVRHVYVKKGSMEVYTVPRAFFDVCIFFAKHMDVIKANMEERKAALPEEMKKIKHLILM